MSDAHKIHVKLGPNEFNAEGSRDAVNEQYGMFLEAIKAMAAAQPLSPRGHGDGGNGSGGGGNGGRQADLTEIDPSVLDHVYMVDGEGQVTLKMLPTGDQRDASGLLLLLYGFRMLGNQTSVLSGRLLDAAKISGLSGVDRIDRVLASQMDLVTKGGTRSGSRWGLRNTGITRAQQIIKGMM